jgi:hypothetical protein
MTDTFTRYSEIIVIPTKEEETVVDVVFTKWICCVRFPSTIQTDGGKEFISNLSGELYTKLEIRGTHTSRSAHPQCNSQAEVFNNTLANCIMNVVDENTLNWEWYLAPLMLCYNTLYHTMTKSTPYELLYGMKPRLPSLPITLLERVCVL